MTAEAKETMIMQIIPASGWFAILDEGTKDEWKYPLVCWALTGAGKVEGRIATKVGVENAETVGNFSSYWHENTRSVPEPEPQPTAEDLAERQAFMEKTLTSTTTE